MLEFIQKKDNSMLEKKLLINGGGDFSLVQLF